MNCLFFFLLLCPVSLFAGPTELLAAARSGDIKKISKELELGVSIESATKDGFTALALAANYGKSDAVVFLISKGAAIETRQKDGYTPFVIACQKNELAVAQILAKAGANVNTRDNYGYTALWVELGPKGRTQTIDFLLSAGADPNCQDDLGHSALMRACRYERSDTAARLIEAGADIGHRDAKNRDAWWWAAYGGSIEAIEIMRKAAQAPEHPLPAEGYTAKSSGFSEGLHIHVFWFELAKGKSSGVLAHHAFPVGIAYPSQIIRSVRSLSPLQTIETMPQSLDNPNYALALTNSVQVQGSRPLYLGFAADVSIFEGLSWTYSGADPPIPEGYPEDIASYVRPSSRYDIDSPLIRKEVANILDGKPGAHETVKRIWNLVNKRVVYDSVPWPNSGSQILQWGKGRCGDFTRAFITLARACGIPARAVWGLGEYPWLSDADHAWLEVYLPGTGWLPVQPQLKPKAGYVYPISFNRFYLMTRYSDEEGLDDWARPSQMFGKGLSKGESPNGVGVFVKLPQGERAAFVDLLMRIIEDKEKVGAEAIKISKRMDQDARLLILWLVSGSADDDAARAAALVAEAASPDEPPSEVAKGEFLDSEAMAQLEQMMKESPSLVRERIQAAIRAQGN